MARVGLESWVMVPIVTVDERQGPSVENLYEAMFCRWALNAVNPALTIPASTEEILGKLRGTRFCEATKKYLAALQKRVGFRVPPRAPTLRVPNPKTKRA